MVVSSAKEVKAKGMDSKSLKFGMDRILSENVFSNSKRLEVPCVSALPCAGCISSLYRSCRTSPGSGNASFYRNGIHAPLPLRPYAKGESNIQHNRNNQQPNATGGASKRKRSWSRAVFSNLQRKGLEKRFQLQKYITKPDRRQLAATLGLTDAQVKVWFQNRRMKWRHTKESSRQSEAMNNSEENILVSADSTQSQNTDSECESDIDVQTVDG